MIKKIIERWKQEWWLKHAAEIAREYQTRQADLEKRLDEELRLNLTRLELERDVIYAKVKAEIEKGKLLEEEVAYRQKTLDDRKLDLVIADNDLKQQIRLIEAKASPSSVWVEAFTSGANKAWELLLPVMTDNIAKLKLKMQEDAVQEAIARMRVTNKK